MDEFRPQVALIDIAMPGMDGYELARRIRSGSDFQDVVLIALTGWERLAQQDKPGLTDFDEHLLKPVDMARLECLLDQFQLRCALSLRQDSVGSSTSV
jgi:CheY-like chemotaxis protein